MSTLFSPAHLHVAINHAPIIGVAVAIVPLLVGILTHSRAALFSGLLAVLLCVGTVPAIMSTGEAARDQLVDGSVEPEMDSAGSAACRIHAGRAQTTAPVAYATGLLALVSMIALIRFPRQAAWIGWGVILGSLLTMALSVWTALVGGRIRHPEFRDASPVKSAPAATPAPTPSLSPQSEGSPQAVPAVSPSATP